MEELLEVLDVFRALEDNSDGYLTREEIIGFLAECGESYTVEDEEWFDSCDQNDDGAISVLGNQIYFPLFFYFLDLNLSIYVIFCHL